MFVVEIDTRVLPEGCSVVPGSYVGVLEIKTGGGWGDWGGVKGRTRVVIGSYILLMIRMSSDILRAGREGRGGVYVRRTRGGRGVRTRNAVVSEDVGASRP